MNNACGQDPSTATRLVNEGNVPGASLSGRSRVPASLFAVVSSKLCSILSTVTQHRLCPGQCYSSRVQSRVFFWECISNQRPIGIHFDGKDTCMVVLVTSKQASHLAIGSQ